MLYITTNIFLLLCIVIVYILVAQAVVQLPAMLIGFLMGVINRFRKSVNKARALKNLTIFEMCFSVILLACYLFFHFKYALWNNSFFYIWSNPLLLFLLYIRAVLGAGHSQSENPILRRLSYIVWISLLPITVLILVGLFTPDTIANWALKWGIALSISIVILGTIISRSMPLEIEKFENLEERQKAIRVKINELLHIVNVIGDAGELKALLGSVNELDRRHSKAQGLLRKAKYVEAENSILQSEIEVIHIEENIKNRINFTFKDEIKSRLERAIIEVHQLEEEFKVASISTEELKNVESSIQKNLSEIDTIQFSTEHIIEYLKPIEDIVNSIAETRVSLSLRKNVGEQMDKIRSEIEKSSMTMDIASSLDLEIQGAKESEVQILDHLDRLKNKKLSGAHELLALYRELQNSLLRFRESIAVLKNILNRRWNSIEIIENRLFSFVPKHCTTDHPSNGAIVLQKKNSTDKHIQISIDGVLVELETERNFSIYPKAGSNSSISSFSFVGKRAGKGKIIFRSPEIKDKISLDITIIPRTIELARDSLFVAVPLGGVTLLILWGLGIDIKEYAALTGAGGGAFGLLIFLIRYIRFSKYKSINTI